MANIMPINIPLPNEPVIASYDWVDLAEGYGYVVLNGLVCGKGTEETDTETRVPMLMKNVISTRFNESNASSLSLASGLATSVAKFEATPFNTPRVIGGEAFVTFAWCYYKDSSPSTRQGRGMAVAQVMINDVVIGSAITRRLSTAVAMAAGNSAREMASLKITLPQTPVKIGDVLSVNITFRNESEVQGDFSSGVRIAHDPLDRDTTNFNKTDDDLASTSFVAYIPFKIDL